MLSQYSCGAKPKSIYKQHYQIDSIFWLRYGPRGKKKWVRSGQVDPKKDPNMDPTKFKLYSRFSLFPHGVSAETIRFLNLEIVENSNSCRKFQFFTS